MARCSMVYRYAKSAYLKGIGGQLHNKSLNTVRFAHWTRKSCAFARLLA